MAVTSATPSGPGGLVAVHRREVGQLTLVAATVPNMIVVAPGSKKFPSRVTTVPPRRGPRLGSMPKTRGAYLLTPEPPSMISPFLIVSLPLPPETRSRPGPPSMTSSSLPPCNVSLPAPPSMWSLPLPPSRKSSPPSPHSTSSPEPPERRSDAGVPTTTWEPEPPLAGARTNR